ncbi:acyltransferase family protein [Corynebacterium pyruviciproducens]|uniref:acyltransferase family protein n=1 Tax=Corynebacterium pyruviciproducens TaxID=598660 RepID=UPI00288B9174|nr:acyltransferase [Corynebacterium pyruviciproducens]
MNRSYIPALDALRAVSALGIMTTHVAFQTGTPGFDRFDYFVAVFFALSGFLLWWRYPSFSTPWGRYARNRFGRIVPAYLAVVVISFVAFNSAGVNALLANLFFVQLYVPGALMTGLTHLWTMCVEVAFYIIFPFLREILGRVPRPWRIAIIILIALASLGWAYLPLNFEANSQIFPPAYCSWYAVGILLAELHSAERVRSTRFPWWIWPPIAIAALVAGTCLGPAGLTHPTPTEFAIRIFFGAVFALALLYPVVDWQPRVPDWLAFLGRISYSIFLWHLPVLTALYALTTITLFSGHFLLVWLLTFAFIIPVSYVSYEWTEKPFHTGAATHSRDAL